MMMSSIGMHGRDMLMTTRREQQTTPSVHSAVVASRHKATIPRTGVANTSHHHGHYQQRVDFHRNKERCSLCLCHASRRNTSSEDLVRGLAFSCTECGECCTGSGHVWLNRAEVSAIAKLLGDVDEDVFIDTYCTGPPRTDGWYMLKNAEDSDACIFLDQETNHCTVYGARPLQCATYPWWPELVQSRKAWAQEARQVCEGILLDDHDDDVELVSSREAAAHLDAFCAYLASSAKENNIDDVTHNDNNNNDNSGIK